MLRTRQETVLRILINEYINSATPVASEDIARKELLKASPATIRNEMAALEEEGYIMRPHISAGAVPSDKGYRYYVESMEQKPVPPLDVQERIRQRFTEAHWDPESWIASAAEELSKIVTNLAIVTFPRASSSKLKYIQLVYLQDLFAMLIIVLQETRLRQHILPIEKPTSQDELTEIANRLSDALSGLSYHEIEAKNMDLGPLEEKVLDDTVLTLKEIEQEASLEHRADGLRMLFNQPEFAKNENARQIAEVLEEKTLLKSLLSEAPEEGDPVVFIGVENHLEALKPFGVILSQYGIPQEASGTIGVIGPTRMEYPNVIATVEFLSSVMSDLMIGLHGRS